MHQPQGAIPVAFAQRTCLCLWAWLSERAHFLCVGACACLVGWAGVVGGVEGEGRGSAQVSERDEILTANDAYVLVR